MPAQAFDEATWLAPFVEQLRRVVQAVADAQRERLADILPTDTELPPLIEGADCLVNSGWASGVLADAMLEGSSVENHKWDVEALIDEMDLPFLSPGSVEAITAHFAAYAGSALGKAMYEISVSVHGRGTPSASGARRN